MEIATKTRIGKIPDTGLLPAWSRRVAAIGALELPLTTQHALTGGSMAWPHRDPVDRMLVAQGIHEGAVLVTVDRVFSGLPVPPLLTW